MLCEAFIIKITRVPALLPIVACRCWICHDLGVTLSMAKMWERAYFSTIVLCEMRFFQNRNFVPQRPPRYSIACGEWGHHFCVEYHPPCRIITQSYCRWSASSIQVNLAISALYFLTPTPAHRRPFKILAKY